MKKKYNLFFMLIILCFLFSGCNAKNQKSIIESESGDYFTHIIAALPDNYQLIDGTFYDNKFYYIAQLKENFPKLAVYTVSNDNLINSYNIEIDGYNFEGVSARCSNIIYAVFSSQNDINDISLFKISSDTKEINKSIKLTEIPDDIIIDGNNIITTKFSESDYLLYRYNENLELVDSPDIIGLPENEYIYELKRLDNKGYCCLLARNNEAQIVFLNDEFQYIGDNKLKLAGTCGYILSNESNILLFQIEEEYISFCEISTKNNTIVDTFEIEIGDFPRGIYDGYGSYKFLISDENNIKGYNKQNQAIEELSCLPNEYISDISITSNEKYDILMQSYDTLTNQVCSFENNDNFNYIDYDDNTYSFFIDNENNYYFLCFEPDRSYIVKKNINNEKIYEIDLSYENEYLAEVSCYNQLFCALIERNTESGIERFIRFIDLSTSKIFKVINLENYEVLTETNIIDIYYSNNTLYLMSDEVIYAIDSKNRISIIPKLTDDLYKGFINCLEKYDFGFYNEFGIYGYNIKQHSLVEIANFDKLEVNIMEKNVIYQISDNELDIIGKENFNSYMELHRFIRSDKSHDLKNEIVISGVEFENIMYRDNFLNTINKINNSSKDIKITIKRYDDRESIQRDFLSGAFPDIIFYNDDEMWLSKYLVDISKYIENSELINQNDYFTNLFNLENKNVVNRVFPSFSLYTLGGKKSEIGNTELWSNEEYLEYMSENSKREAVLGSEISDVLCKMFISNLNSYIDYDKGICSFDNKQTYELMDSIKKCIVHLIRVFLQTEWPTKI